MHSVYNELSYAYEGHIRIYANINTGISLLQQTLSSSFASYARFLHYTYTYYQLYSFTIIHNKGTNQLLCGGDVNDIFIERGYNQCFCWFLSIPPSRPKTNSRNQYEFVYCLYLCITNRKRICRCISEIANLNILIFFHIIIIILGNDCQTTKS